MSLTPSRLGQANGAGSATALFLQVFGGEVLTSFRTKTVTMGRHQVRTIKQGKSASFPATGKGTAAYHTPGALITGTSVNHNERVITIDDLLIAARSIASIDEAMNHWDVRSEYASDAADALAQKFDINVLRVIGNAARASATVTGGNGGTAITDADGATNADSLIGAAFDAAQAMDEKDVPENDRYFAVKPAQYYLLVESGSRLIHSDYNPESNGSFSQGRVHRVAGMEIVKTNNLPDDALATGPSAYQGDFSTTIALAWQKQAAGTVKLLDLAVESEWKMEYQAWLTIAKYALGSGVLRPECAVEIKSA